jgi:hypothetical protein
VGQHRAAIVELGRQAAGAGLAGRIAALQFDTNQPAPAGRLARAPKMIASHPP